MTGRKGGSAQARAQGQEPKALFPLLALLPEALEESALVFRGGTHRLGFEGGTSFVAPQLNGISALLTQATHGRQGLWNPQLYAFQNIFRYGAFSPFNDVKAGDNWFYKGVSGYEPGAGLGTLNVTNLALFMTVF